MREQRKILNPRTVNKEFGGVWGTLGISLFLPVLINLLYFSCNGNGCPPALTQMHWLTKQISQSKLLSLQAFYWYLTWFSVLFALDRLVPGKSVVGTELRDGKRLQYKFNGKYIMLILFLAIGFRCIQTTGDLPELVFVYDHFIEIANVSIMVAFTLSTLLYLWSFRRSAPLLALGGNTGNVIYDWFMGRELNPRLGNFDLKLFLEMRPGLLLWIVIDLTMAHHQYLSFGKVSNSMILVCLFQIYYVLEGTFYEEGLISMIDTTNDGLGFMLVFGDISLVPFTYSLQARYLAENPIHLTKWVIVAILAVYIGGMSIFRLSNNEKAKFKKGDKSVAHLKYLTSESGSKLIYTGWWGLARHVNYFGDWLSALAYCLPCGKAIIPYYYMVYFAALLIHREQRDEAKCAHKYKETWIEYKQRVPYRLIPFVY